MSRKLERYQEKRDFTRTPEPRGRHAHAGARPLQFVVQRHDARRLHYDLRLEHDGVLKSWAVTKVPSLDPNDRRLAIRTEDHPLEYGSFEGEIPANQYGAGSVVIWDRGEWIPHVDPDRGLEEGKLDFELHGERLRGRWTLVRMADRGERKGKESWLLIKRREQPGTKSPTAKRTAAPRAAKAAAKRDSIAIPGAKRAAMPSDLRPQLATRVTSAPEGNDWLHEPKLDGYRLLCRIASGKAKLITRRGLDWTDRFPAIAQAAGGLPCKQAWIDGEAVVFDRAGLTDFQRLQNSIATGDPSLVLVAFDLMYLDGFDFHDVPLLARKAELRRLLENAAPPIRFGDHVEGNGTAFFEQACEAGLEGIVSKRGQDPYRAGRSKSWLKVKCVQRQEFVIAGYTDPGGSRTGFGALLLGVRDARGGPLRYAGKVGTGFDERSLRALLARLKPLERKHPPVDRAGTRGLGSGVHWVEPKLVAEIAFTEWTSDGRLRHPTFKGLREDKPAEEIVEERAVPTEAATSEARAAKRGSSRAAPKAAAEALVKLSSPDKVLWPDPGITKREYLSYWEETAEVALPYMLNRPLTLLRCPDGYGASCFYQKHVGVGVPQVVPRVVIKEDEEPYAMVDGLTALSGLVQIGVLEFHVWGSRAEHLDQPDIIVFDLDPDEGLPWRAVVDAAHELKERLEALDLVPFPRVTGGKGLHLVIPVVPGPRWPAVKKFARAVATEMVRDDPKRYTANMAKIKRRGKVFVDYLRNDRESTAIACYSPRARAGAPVAMPLGWDQLEGDADEPPRFSMRDVPKWIRERGRDPWAGFESARRSLMDE